MNDEQAKTIVLFRVDNDGVCFAIFPFVDEGRGLVSTFDMNGGHSAGQRGAMIGASRVARPEEYAAIHRVLTSKPYGYRLAIRTRTPRFDPYRKKNQPK